MFVLGENWTVEMKGGGFSESAGVETYCIII